MPLSIGGRIRLALYIAILRNRFSNNQIASQIQLDELRNFVISMSSLVPNPDIAALQSAVDDMQSLI